MKIHNMFAWHVTISAYINDYNRTIACYGIGAIIFLIVTVNMEYHFIVLNYRSRFGFSDIDSVCCNLFFSFLLSYLQFEFLSVSP